MIKKIPRKHTDESERSSPRELKVACFHNASISITVVEFFQTTASNPQSILFEDIRLFRSSNLQVTIYRVCMSVLREDLRPTFVFP